MKINEALMASVFLMAPSADDCPHCGLVGGAMGRVYTCDDCWHRGPWERWINELNMETGAILERAIQSSDPRQNYIKLVQIMEAHPHE